MISWSLCLCIRVSLDYWQKRMQQVKEPSSSCFSLLNKLCSSWREKRSQKRNKVVAGIGSLIVSSLLDQRTPAPPLHVPCVVGFYFVNSAKNKRLLRSIALSACISLLGFRSVSFVHLSEANSRLFGSAGVLFLKTCLSGAIRFFGLESVSFRSASVLFLRVRNADDELFERVSSPIRCASCCCFSLSRWVSHGAAEWWALCWSWRLFANC